MADDVQNLKIIKEFLTEYRTQYRRGNRAPIYFTIMDYYTEFVPDRSGDPYLYQPDDGTMLSYRDYRKEYEKISLEEFESLPDIIYGFKEAKSFRRGLFLTESDAEEHLRKRTYPNLVQKGKMTQKQADNELAAMVAVLNTLNEKSEPTLF